MTMPSSLSSRLATSTAPLVARRRQRVVVAMSGGVDSAVAAGLACREGHEVIGVTLHLHDQPIASARQNACCGGRDVHDARRVADILDIPHYVLDYEKAFEAAVIAPFIEAYRRGETPNPCIRCNEMVKFGPLLETARDLGADMLVTGHYAWLEGEGEGRCLHRADDASRDQSYFLFALAREDFRSVAFPLGKLDKRETRHLAAEFGFGALSAKPDSQDICFVPPGRDYRALLKKTGTATGTGTDAGTGTDIGTAALKRGDDDESGVIVDRDGTELGRHDGVGAFTIGQRRGLGVTAGRPLFVIDIDAERQRVTLGERRELASRSFRLRGVNWLVDGAEIMTQGRVMVKTRARGKLVSARLELVTDDKAETHERLHVVPDQPQEAVTPGQACVFYADNSPGSRVLGGGWIDSVAR